MEGEKHNQKDGPISKGLHQELARVMGFYELLNTITAKQLITQTISLGYYYEESINHRNNRTGWLIFS